MFRSVGGCTHTLLLPLEVALYSLGEEDPFITQPDDFLYVASLSSEAAAEEEGKYIASAVRGGEEEGRGVATGGEEDWMSEDDALTSFSAISSPVSVRRNLHDIITTS